MLGARLSSRSEFKTQAIMPSKSRFPPLSNPGDKKDCGAGPEMKSTLSRIYFMEDFEDEHFRKPYEFKNLYLSR